MSCGVPSQQQWKEFVCGTNGAVPYGISKNGNNARSGGFVNDGEASGFRSADTNSEGFRSSNGGGFRSNGGASIDTNSEVRNEDVKSNNGGGFRTK